MLPKINFKYAPKKKQTKSKPLTPRTVRVIDNYVKSLPIVKSLATVCAG